jgi:hypothetical protein
VYCATAAGSVPIPVGTLPPASSARVALDLEREVERQQEQFAAVDVRPCWLRTAKSCRPDVATVARRCTGATSVILVCVRIFLQVVDDLPELPGKEPVRIRQRQQEPVRTAAPVSHLAIGCDSI